MQRAVLQHSLRATMKREVETHRNNVDAILEIVPTGLFTLDHDMRVRSMNQAAEKLLGLSAGEGLGLTCKEILGEHICAPDCAFRKSLHEGLLQRDWSVKVRLRRGDRRELLLSTAFLGAESEDQHQVAVSVKDITEAERLHRALHERWVFHGLICASAEMKEVVTLVRELAPFDSTVLVLGESGTGKEVIARAMHAESKRRSKPFVTVNCSAYSEGLLESELFGHVAGSFTGAMRDRQGRFESADGGTVFLDEIGEISPAIQVKLLRVLQERTIERVGDQKTVPVDIRVVAATNRDLRQEVRDDNFREDLFYRLNVITVDVPPLRQRRNDIPALTEHFVPKYAQETGKKVDSVSEEALETLLRYDWPGNVRELENAIEHAVVRTHSPIILPKDLPQEVRGVGSDDSSSPHESRIEAAMAATGGKVGRAAEILGVHRTTLWRWLKNNGRA
jgi:PAS domain S-box-containing protein